jgi:hypothetical protein
MAPNSSQAGIVCSACKSPNPPGRTSCQKCQRFLGTIPAPRPSTTRTATSPTVGPPATAPQAVVRPAPTRPVPAPTVTPRPPSVPPTATVNRTGTGTVATRGTVTTPEDGTTRYLCAAVHRRDAFTDSIIEEFLMERQRAAPPSPGLDSAAVLRDAVAARARRRARDAVLLALLALLAVVAPGGVLLWLVVGLVAGRARPSGGTVQRHVVGVVQPAVAAATAVAVPVVSAVSGLGWLGGPPAAVVAALLTLGTLAVLGADEFAVHRLVRERFQAGEFLPDYRHSPVAWERRLRGLGQARYQEELDRVAAADEYGPHAAGRADVIVHRSRSPFIGAGLALETQTIALPLEPDPNRPQGPDPISVNELHEHIAQALDSVNVRSSLFAGARTDRMLHREQVLIPTDGLAANLRTALGAAALKDRDHPPARHVALKAARTLAEQPQEWARYYSCFRVESWNRDLATSCYFYAGTDQQMIYLELTHCVLPPIMERFQDIDYVVEFGKGPVCATAREFLRLPTTVWTRLRTVLRRMQPRTRRTRGFVPEYYGAHRSLREHVAIDARPSLYFLQSDAKKYVKIVDTKLFKAVGDYLQQHGYDVVEFQRAVRTTINNNSVNISGGNFMGNTAMTVGNNATATASGSGSATGVP